MERKESNQTKPLDANPTYKTMAKSLETGKVKSSCSKEG